LAEGLAAALRPRIFTLAGFPRVVLSTGSQIAEKAIAKPVFSIYKGGEGVAFST
jgi:hypothetical protein